MIMLVSIKDFESDRRKLESTWRYGPCIHSDENYSVRTTRSRNDVVARDCRPYWSWHAHRPGNTEKKENERSRVLGKWFARACRARDIEDRSPRASSSCRENTADSIVIASPPFALDFFPLFKRIRAGTNLLFLPPSPQKTKSKRS